MQSFRVHCPDRSVPTSVTDRGDDPPISGHDNDFAKLHAHDGVIGARKDAATTVVTIDRWREMLMASDACGAHLPVIFSAGCCRVSVDVTHTSFRPAGAAVRYVDVLDTGVG